ncbi:uncharacterized protein LOC110834918 [Zootermopsis nevadensis]|uniref:Uncharacterized protein n=1 Tax=Zootermopsis nevadensis TaxID=136037 RepID=A0A067R6U3_ZOONE|nr:uncharacterized protein LOC110834918 [Zootermopsis nevadensis]KDR14014.1 hypothetical protein L798_11673 [Zootermopsis nevadensis]
MSDLQRSDIPWMDESDEWGASAASSFVTENGEATVLVGVVIAVLAAVIILFILALLIDCRTRKHVSPASRISGKTTAIPKRTKFPQFIRNSATNNENITFANQMCTENSATLPAVPGSVENC